MPRACCRHSWSPASHPSPSLAPWRENGGQLQRPCVLGSFSQPVVLWGFLLPLSDSPMA